MKPFEEFSEEEIIKEVNRSLFPTLWCCRAVLPEMVKNQKGTIVNVSSIATRGIHRVPYSASKGGVNGLTASLAFEHAKDGLSVSMPLQLVVQKHLPVKCRVMPIHY